MEANSMNDISKTKRTASIFFNGIERILSFGEKAKDEAPEFIRPPRQENALLDPAQFPIHGDLDPREYNLGPFLAVGKKYRIDVVGLWSNGGGPAEGCRDANGDPTRVINGLPAWCLVAQPHAASDGEAANNILPVGTRFEIANPEGNEPLYLVFFMNDDDYSDNHKCTQPGMTPMRWTVTQI
jgi:hypothetical protein